MNIITDVLGWPLGVIMWACYSLVSNYGIALLLFTLITKLALFPLAVKQQKTSAKMALFQPKLKELEKKYGNNKQKLQQEQMKLYETEGYNPMSGCLPMLIQMPIIFGLIGVIYNPISYVLRMGSDVIESAKGIISNLGITLADGYMEQISIINAVKADPGAFSSLGNDVVTALTNFDMSFFGLDLGATPQLAWAPLVILPILSGLTAILSSLISMKFNVNAQITGNQMGRGTKGMMLIMPLFSLFFAFSVAGGVVLYWIYSNLFAGLQSILIAKLYPPEKLREIAKADQKKHRKKIAQRKANMVMRTGDGEVVRDSVDKEEKTGMYQGEVLSVKEINRRRLADARRRDAEKYGEVYKEVTDADLE